MLFKSIFLFLLIFQGTKVFADHQVWTCELGKGSCEDWGDYEMCYKSLVLARNWISYSWVSSDPSVEKRQYFYKFDQEYDYFYLNDEKFSASWQGIEHFIRATSTDGLNYQGILVLEQDFEMEINCRLIK